MKKWFIIALTMALWLTGCQDQKDLLNLLFPTTVVIDYSDNRYHLAFQIHNFNSISRGELESGQSQDSILIVQGEGKTIEEAIGQIESEQRSALSLSHIRSLIIQSGMLEQSRIQDLINYLTYNMELRMDTSLYYSEDDPSELLSVSYQIGKSAIYTLSNSPEFKDISMENQTINLLEFAKGLSDREITLSIPILKVDTNRNQYIGSEGEQEQKVYLVSECLFLDGKGNYTRLAIDRLEGRSWVRSHFNDVNVSYLLGDEVINFDSYRVTSWITYNPKDGCYHLKGKVRLTITRAGTNTSLEDLKQLAEELIKSQVSETYLAGLEAGVDVYNLTYHSLIKEADPVPLTAKNFINELDVNLVIKGAYVEVQ